jgi:tripartite-type tricarboxylate transporter receptor subunit TctC
MQRIARRAVLALPALAALPAMAQPFPPRPVRLVAPFAAGASLDATSRLFARFLEARWGQSVVVENRTGAAGNIGAEFVARAAPDGLTLLVAPTGMMTVNPSLYPNLGFSIENDLTPVAMLGSLPNVMVVPASSAATNVAEFLAAMRAANRPILYGSPGAGSLVHLSAELFLREAGIAGTHVPYRGSAPALVDLVAGRIDVMFENQPGALPLIRDGRLRALAVTAPRRSAALPEVPTTAEAGLPNVLAVPWFALFAPARTPPEILEKIAADVAAGQQDPTLRAALEALGLTPETLGPAQLGTLVTRERALFGGIVRAANIRVE